MGSDTGDRGSLTTVFAIFFPRLTFFLFLSRGVGGVLSGMVVGSKVWLPGCTPYAKEGGEAGRAGTGRAGHSDK